MNFINSDSFPIVRWDGTNISIKLDPAYIHHIILDCISLEGEERGNLNIDPTGVCFCKPSEYSLLSTTAPLHLKKNN